MAKGLQPGIVSSESWASSHIARATMRANRSRDTTPEKLLRSALHALGLRFRVSARPIPSLNRTADIVFRPARIAVFVDGCFWHGCTTHYTAPRANADFWRAKIQRNQERDRQTDEQLAAEGWTVMRFWEHEDLTQAAVRIEEAVRKARPSRSAKVRHR
ncbi:MULTISPECIES: very short patch repair endonuclease [Mycobacterium]|uniref:very short patch repair endonuclease n=1 Tax=Mycobacterium TaxID=1763 RepID=UPI001EF0DBDF|nr:MULTISPECIES: very short patch repair endonuclease [Mycobacterium]